MWFFLTALVMPAAAEIPVPSFKEETIVAMWHEIDDQIEAACLTPASGPSGGTIGCVPEQLREAIDRGGQFNEQVVETARIHALMGHAWRFLGDVEQAESEYRSAIRVNDQRADAWAGLGEVLQSQSKFEEAKAAYAKVNELAPGHDAWVAWFHLAEIAAFQGDAVAFEANLREALGNGFSFRQIQTNSLWREFYKDPEIHDSIEKLVKIYGDRGVLDSLAEPQPSP